MPGMAQGAGGTGGALASRQVPAGLEQQMEELRRMAEAARGSAAVAEQRAEAAEAEAAAAKAALQQAQDDLGRDEVRWRRLFAVCPLGRGGRWDSPTGGGGLMLGVGDPVTGDLCGEAGGDARP